MFTLWFSTYFKRKKRDTLSLIFTYSTAVLMIGLILNLTVVISPVRQCHRCIVHKDY